MFYKHKEGGFSKRLYRMYNALAREGHDVHYLACEPFPISNSRIHFHRIPAVFKDTENLLFWLLFFTIAPVAALWVCHRVRADRLVVFGSWYAALMCLPRFLLGRKLICFLRADSVFLYEIEGRSLPAKIANCILETIGLAIADEVWANIGSVKGNIVKKYKLREEKIGILHNNIDAFRYPSESERLTIREQFGLQRNVYAIVTSGIFYKRKNMPFLIRAFADASLGPRTILLVVGDDVGQGTERTRLEELTEGLGVRDLVIFTGWQTNSVDIIGACDLYVLPSLHEGFPNSLLDAMSVGCLCLGSRTPELEEVLYYDQLLFTLDNTNELSGILKRLAIDHEYREFLSELCTSRAKHFHFNWDKIVVEKVTA